MLQCSTQSCVPGPTPPFHCCCQAFMLRPAKWPSSLHLRLASSCQSTPSSAWSLHNGLAGSTVAPGGTQLRKCGGRVQGVG